MGFVRIDLHTHSDVSDGTDAPADVVRAAAAAGLDVVALADHDTFDGLAEAERAASGLGLGFVRGMEMSTAVPGPRGSDASVHLLAYGADAADPELVGELARVRQGRSGRLPAMLAKLAHLGMPLSEADVRARAAGAASLGRPHVADALVAAGHVAHRDQAFERWLYDGGPAWVDRYTTPLERAVDLVNAAGGVAVIAHPWGRGGRELLSSDRLEALVVEHGLDGWEADHTDHDDDPDTSRALFDLAERLGVLALGSSDHHGTGKRHNPLGVHTTRPEQYAALLDRMAARRGGAASGLR